MKTIWKFPFSVNDDFVLLLPQGAQILSVQTQGAQPCIWALVNPSLPTEPRSFRVFGTGHPFDMQLFSFVGTFQMYGGSLVFHLFEGQR